MKMLILLGKMGKKVDGMTEKIRNLKEIHLFYYSHIIRGSVQDFVSASSNS